MLINRNSWTSNEIIEATKINYGADGDIPQEISKVIQPVIVCNPKLVQKIDIIKSVAGSSTGTVTVWTVPANQDFFLIGAMMSCTKDVTCDMGTGSMAMSIGTDRLLIFSILTLTAQDLETHMVWSRPVFVPRGTAITIGGAWTAGACQRCASIHGYLQN
jgi:hypothetical protein